MENCKNCNREISAEALLCPGCGTKVNKQEVSSRTTPSGAGTLSGLRTFVDTNETELPQVSSLKDGDEFHKRYQVKRQIGAGAMGVVYLADDQVTDRQVVLKLINPALVKSPTAIQRFLREGLTARDIRHPNVIAMYDVGEDDGQLFLVMEYIEGEDLRNWIHRVIQLPGKDLQLDVIISLVTNILEGLKAAHAANVIHRDLKPENVMLTGDPLKGEYQIKILDFGIARAIDTASTTMLTNTGSATGTPLYMAPEQLTAADTVTASADLYSVTAILYEFLMGVPPGGVLGEPSKERDDVPEAMDRVIKKGLSSRPRSRYQSADEYLDALNNLADDKPKPPPTTTPAPAPPDPPKPNRTKQYAIAAGIAVLGIIAWYEDDSEPINPPGQTSMGQGYPPLSVTSTPTPTPTPTQPPPPPPPQPTGLFSGVWYDEVLPLGVAHGYVILSQEGTSVDGDFYDLQNNAIGTVSGEAEGGSIIYDYEGMGGTGSGMGVLRMDGTHIDIQVMGDQGGVESHVLHKDHLPN